jgi:hypothetical protein
MGLYGALWVVTRSRFQVPHIERCSVLIREADI